MIQFNLLPDIKNQYLQTQRTKRLIIVTSAAISGLFITAFASMLILVTVVQKNHIKNLQKDIENSLTEIKKVPDLEKILTIQNQLGSLTALHDAKPVTSRLYNYLVQITPRDATISSVDLSFEGDTIKLAGIAKNLEVVNKFVDTIKFTNYELTTNETPAKVTAATAFSDVVLDGFSSGRQSQTASQVSYSISFKFNPIIFSINKDSANKPQTVALKVPQIISTRSVLEKPTDIFKEAPKTEPQINTNGAQ